jgi:hypothetical protein
MSIRFSGRIHRAWTLGYVAKELDRSLPTLQNWVWSGMIPGTPFHSDGGQRLYTRGMIDVIVEACARRAHPCGRKNRIRRHDTTFSQEIEAGWCELGIFGLAFEHVA